MAGICEGLTQIGHTEAEAAKAVGSGARALLKALCPKPKPKATAKATKGTKLDETA